jgi:hypothetical protein
MHEIARRDVADRHERAEIHQKAAVAVEHDHSPLGAGQRQAETVRRRETHGADGHVIQRMIGPRRNPVEGGAVGADHDVVGNMPCKNLEALIALHHDGIGLRPRRIASGRLVA